MNDYESAAAALFDGGWTSEDKEQLIEEYALTKEEAETICKELSRFESEAGV